MDILPLPDGALSLALTSAEFGRLYGVVMTMDVSFDPLHGANPLNITPADVRQMARALTEISQAARKAARARS